MAPFAIAAIGFAAFLLLAFFGLPVAIALALPGFIGIALLTKLDPAFMIIGGFPYSFTSAAFFIPIPLFVLMGNFAFYSGIGAELFNAAYKWLGRLPGGLALASMAACAAFGGCTGSTVAATATMTTITFPEMERYKYSQRLSTAVICAGGTLAWLIPPSTIFLIYAMLTEQNVARLFIAGIFPGILLSLLFLITIFVMCKRNPKLGPVVPTTFTWRERFVSLKGAWGMLALFILVIGGLFLGVFTPSEAGAIGAFGAFVLTVAKIRLKKSAYYNALIESLKVTGMVITVIIGAQVFTTFLSLSGFSKEFATALTSLDISPHYIVIAILVMYLVLGTFMEETSMTVLTIPIVAPVITALGLDLIWFGVMFVIMLEMGIITPPTAMNVFLVAKLTKVSIADISIGVLPFIADMILCVAILFVFPQISLFLPNLMM